MDIRASQKDIDKLKKIKTKIKFTNLSFNADNEVEVPVIMISTEKGELIEWSRGYENVSSFLKYGYVRIIKKCPYRHRKCIGEKCSLYFIKNLTGDCIHVWNMFK